MDTNNCVQLLLGDTHLEDCRETLYAPVSTTVEACHCVYCLMTMPLWTLAGPEGSGAGAELSACTPHDAVDALCTRMVPLPLMVEECKLEACMASTSTDAGASARSGHQASHCT